MEVSAWLDDGSSGEVAVTLVGNQVSGVVCVCVLAA
jgi:hypothetical protein